MITICYPEEHHYELLKSIGAVALNLGGIDYVMTATAVGIPHIADEQRVLLKLAGIKYYTSYGDFRFMPLHFHPMFQEYHGK